MACRKNNELDFRDCKSRFSFRNVSLLWKCFSCFSCYSCWDFLKVKILGSDKALKVVPLIIMNIVMRTSYYYKIRQLRLLKNNHMICVQYVCVKNIFALFDAAFPISYLHLLFIYWDQSNTINYINGFL